VKPGGEVPLTLAFEGGDCKRQTLELKALARPLNTAMGGDGKGHDSGPGGTHGGTHRCVAIGVKLGAAVTNATHSH